MSQKALTRIATWNLTDPDDRIEFVDFDFGTPYAIRSLEDLRGKSEPLVLYVLAHAIPNGLKTEAKTILDEAHLVKELHHLRGALPTLVIFDMCFAESFEKLDGVSWGDNFVRIFSCSAYERTWHTGETNPRRTSLFSSAVNAALTECKASNDYSALSSMLKARVGGLQTPVIGGSPRHLLEIL